MSKAKKVEMGYAIKQDSSLRFVGDEGELTTIGSAALFENKLDAVNRRDRIAFRGGCDTLVVVQVRVTTEEV